MKAEVLNFPMPEVPVEETNQEGGYIKLYRGFMDHPFYKDSDIKAVWLHLLFLATSKPYETMLGNQVVQLEPGQLICGTFDLANELGLSRQNIRTILGKLEAEGMIARNSTNKGSLITVVKYSAYQGKNTKKANQQLTSTFNQQTNQQTNQRKPSNGGASGNTSTSEPTSSSTSSKTTKLTTIQENKNNTPNGVLNTCGAFELESEPAKPKPKTDQNFEEAWKSYPKREGSNPKNKALECWRARLAEGVKPEDMLAGVQRYAAFIAAKGNLGTGFVMQAKRFFGTSREFENDWTVAAPPPPTRPDGRMGYRDSGFDQLNYGETQVPDWARD